MKYTITKSIAERILQEMNCPMTGYKGGHKEMVKEIKMGKITGTNKTRYIIVLKDGLEINSKKEWNEYHNGGMMGAFRSSMRHLEQINAK